ncbi:MAG: MotA/TolQ/ExbB proton channel family protein [Deltaproteobacteria bacterium]|nr:MotA/TolQ/ExbB proton channel family protein [Deltaproteobacteria bacterium]
MRIEINKYSFEVSMIIFVGAIILTGIFYLPIYFLSHDSYLRAFFYRCWYVQMLTTWLFLAALLFIILRFILLRSERRILDKKVALENIEENITVPLAKELLEAIPSQYQHAISFRRLGEILWAYVRREEVVRLNQELSRRDLEQIEGGYVVLNALKQLIPVLGFLGTVVGLSLGMAKFPELSETAGNFESLRTILKDLAASLSVSFDTTLLALGYTVIIVLLASFLRREEEQFVVEVDDKARHLIAKLTDAETEPGSLSQSSLDVVVAELVNKLAAQMETSLKEVGQRLGHSLENLLKKLEELRDGIQNPPQYEILVQPLKGRSNE